MTKTHLVIPARYKSTRLPAKPLLAIHGKPMILWTAAKAAKAVADGVADDYCVATDDERIAIVCRQADVPVVLTGNHHASGTDRLGELARLMDYDTGDIVINLQGDEPLVPTSLLVQLKDLLIQKSDCAMATLCEPISDVTQFHTPSIVKVAMANREALYFSRSPIPYCRDNPDDISQAYRHLGLYAYRVQLLQDFATWEQGTLESLESLEQLRVLENGKKIAIDVAGVSLPVGVDTKEDLDRLNAMSLEQLQAYA